MRNIVTGIVVASTLWLSGCIDEASSPESNKQARAPDLIIAGSATMEPMVSAMAKRFEATHPGVMVRVEGGGSLHGILSTRKEGAHIGMVSRNLKNEESDLHGYPIARDGIAIVVHRTNPVTGLTKAQIRDIYQGKITRWSQVSGANAPITVISRTTGRSSLALFIEHFQIKEKEIKAAQAIDNNAPAFKAVADDVNAVVFISIGETERRSAEGIPIKSIAVDGVSGTVANVRNGSYPVLRPLLLVTRRFPEGKAKEFIDFSLSSQVVDIIKANEFVPYLD